MANKEASGFSLYYRTLPDGTEEPCGIRLNLAETQPETVSEAVIGQRDKCVNVALILNGDQPPLEYSNEDLGRTPNTRREVLNGVAQMANQWGKILIIMGKDTARNENDPEQ